MTAMKVTDWLYHLMLYVVACAWCVLILYLIMTSFAP